MGRVTHLFKAARQGRLKTMLLALWKLFKHPQTPLAAKLVAVAVIAYAVSPIDLVPDFIPVLGQLDDLILLPLGIALAVWLVPAPLWEAQLREAEAQSERLPSMLWGAVAIVLLWLLVGAALAWWWVQRQS